MEWPKDKLTDEEIQALFQEYNDTKSIDVRNVLVNHYLYVAQVVAKKFSGRGIEYEDLLQVASLALIKAIERFELDKGFKFSSFATPTIIGEVKNYFRDKMRIMRFPRRDSEELKKIELAQVHLEQSLFRAPKPDEIAKEAGLTTERVLELLEARAASYVSSLDSYLNDEESTDLLSFLGKEDKGYSEIENSDFFKQVLSKLSDDEKSIIIGRYVNGLSQRAIAEKLNVSQMYVSRMERKILDKLRKYIA